MVLCTMSPARLTALLLLVPMAMATCPCPPVLQSSKVCGSNSVTYDSQCALDCAAVQQPGLVTAHPGSCSDSHNALKQPTIGNPSNKPRSSVRSSVDDLQKIRSCQKTKCDSVSGSCGCSSGDTKCNAKCGWTCYCDCFGVSAGKSDATQVAKCMAQNNCIENTISCGIRCGADDECNAKCALDNFDCQCKCNGSLSLRPTLGVAVALLSAWLIRTIG
ncbi:SPARC-related modular calcium-binding protein 1-like [Frankliniella occidentalis]|uniref:SPARC-related modular calcium-binding protein 1-like n=1 Tax=Frankliniella occidentalis TaxID=133901 RepID=A0A6J1T6N7_FRAOC|nr:SPARC-related modular calcium-binding protein 1-like [Frankliniella occidentalis]